MAKGWAQAAAAATLDDIDVPSADCDTPGRARRDSSSSRVASSRWPWPANLDDDFDDYDLYDFDDYDFLDFIYGVA